MRQCGDCTLCCRLLAVRELDKGAGERCRHQFSKGCRVYRKPGFPRSCALWNCGWLGDPDTRDMRRPDRSHYVVDIMPDFVMVENNTTGEQIRLNVVQVWCDPKHPEAWRDPALMAYIERRAERDRMATLVRYNATEGFAIFAPCLSDDYRWHIETRTRSTGRTHTIVEILLGP